MVGDATAPMRRDRLYPANLDEKRNELPTSLGEFLRPREVLGIVREELGVVHPQHAGARARGSDDIIIAGEGIDYLQSNQLGVYTITGVVGRLPATGLAARDFDRTPGIFEQLDRRKTYCRPEQIHQARNKQSYTHSVGPAVNGSEQEVPKLGAIPLSNQSERTNRPGARRPATARGSRR